MLANQTAVTVPKLCFINKFIYRSGDWSLSSFTTLRAILVGFSILDAAFYPLNREKYAEIKQKLDERDVAAIRSGETS